MNSSTAVYDGIKKAGINFIVSVPCVNLSEILIMIDEDDEIMHVPVTREEEGVGVCAGAFLAGKKVAILMQNSGIGNCVNALASLYELYHLPLVMIISHRGTIGEPINGQIPMGRATEDVLDALDIYHKAPTSAEEANNIIGNSWNNSKISRSPVAILLDVNYW